MLELKLNSNDLRKLMGMMHDCLYAKSHEDILSIIDLLNDVIPFNAAILCRKGGSNFDALLDESVNHSYPAEWVKYYFNNKLFVHDQVAAMSNRLNEPFTWASAYQGIDITDETKEFINLAEDYGLKEGLTYACNIQQRDSVNTLLSLETSGVTVSDEYLSIIEYILPHIHEAIVGIDETAQIANDIPSFTVRQTETLKWAYEGKTAWEIGIILSISERTVKFHLKNIYQKLNASNRAQAVAKAIRYGIV